AVIMATSGGDVTFGTASTAGNAIINLSGDSEASFTASSTADHCQITAQGAVSSIEPGVELSVGDNATAGEATFVLEGGSVTGADGTVMTFFNEGSAGNANITVNGGTGGGRGAQVLFQSESDGGTASFSLSGDGKVDLSRHDPGVVTVGSIAGDGQVVLGARALAVGSNNQSTAFSGVIQGSGSLSKIGTGTLTLSGANTYSGGTTVSAGALAVRNPPEADSATGTGAVQVNGGTLAGGGSIAGAVTLGSGSGAGAVLSPGQGASKPTRLTLESSLTFKADASYRCRLNLKKAKNDLVTANGATIESGAQFNFQAVGRGRVRAGKVATVLSNTAATPISGTFANLPEGATLEASGNTLQVSYHGGDGNDLTLTVVP
ncbi:MAG: autotransporter-associated beta strand repeat-containing protein, partial [Verrucomicrobiota bacterium]|nr:autotransporter-associated beta strand repeat-containing protein [Verrucomicrobiota bacterium]